jgi:hypothetical protein
VSADHDADDECNETAEGGPYAPDLPIYPNCTCSYTINALTGE